MILTSNFLKKTFGQEKIKGTPMLYERFEKIMYLYTRTFPGIDIDKCLTKAINAMEFILNAEVYFTEIGAKKGKDFFLSMHSEFLKFFDYQSVIDRIDRTDKMLLLYSPYSTSQQRISANGVIGTFLSMERFYHWDNPYSHFSNEPETNSLVINLRIFNNGIISLPAYDMVYFGKSRDKLELII